MEKDYKTVCREVWEKFILIYGGGPAIIRCEQSIYSEPAPEEVEAYRHISSIQQLQSPRNITKVKPFPEKLGPNDNLDRKLNIFEKRVSMKKIEHNQSKNSMLAAQLQKIKETNERHLKSTNGDKLSVKIKSSKEVKITDTTLICESSSSD